MFGMDLRPRHSRTVVATLVIATFLIVDLIGLHLFHAVVGDRTGWPRMAVLGIFGYGLYLVGPLLAASALFGPHRMFAALGFTASPWPALALTSGCCAVVFAWSAATAAPTPLHALPIEITRGALLPGAAEEILFRAFLFGFLYRFAGWGFLPAALLSSIVFGIEHVYQGGNFLEAWGIAALTGIGALWGSWLLVEWRWNIWVPIGFHVLLNANFEAFMVADNALGSAPFVAVRLACILMSIVVTLWLARHRGGRRLMGGRWWRN